MRVFLLMLVLTKLPFIGGSNNIVRERSTEELKKFTVTGRTTSRPGASQRAGRDGRR